METPSFDTIRRFAIQEIASFSEAKKKDLFDRLDRGLALLDDHLTLCQYMNSFGKMHKAKLQDAFKELPSELFDQKFDVIDWGCGQGMGSINLFDHILKRGKSLNVRKVTLIEPSSKALERARLHTSVYLNKEVELVTINKFFESISKEEIKGYPDIPVIHIFSNILDVAQIDLKYLSRLIDSTVLSDNFLVCVGPLNPGNQRIDAFMSYFDKKLIDLIFEKEDPYFYEKWTFKCKLYKLEVNEIGHLIPIEYFPPVQFQAGYVLDIVRDQVKDSYLAEQLKFISHFEVAAPFDLGASVYEDIHPILAVLNNIITRGVPTKPSILVEEVFSKCFGLTDRSIRLGGISFPSKPNVSLKGVEKIVRFERVNLEHLSEYELVLAQLILSPLAIGRFHKILIEALITGHISLKSKVWNLLIEEADVPFAALAIEDFKQLFTNLTELTFEYDGLKLPEINLTIIGNDLFKDSGLHLGHPVHETLPKDKSSVGFDLVFTLSMLKAVDEKIEGFSSFKAKNNCYFNTRNIQNYRSKRQIYTSSLIKYKNLVKKDTRGNYQEIEENVTKLTYFLQLLFRKESFRPGQLPILDRALQNLPVIGLLPTGGGKSLTYQIPVLMQPGIALIVDPLKSLMKDQYDGLLAAGIDSCTYINSSLTTEEKKKREDELESSQLQFVFLSPERLSILSFRKRLYHMHSYNVYFSYGVIDEVHCVSEWGHDFRFSYLHLGRNLYNYVRAKEGPISLFGLTATASFDVLADVERELSGNGAFDLDPDTIVRYENTNRLELQYKIEKVRVEFKDDEYYDRNKKMPAFLPRAKNITDKWTPFKFKAAFLRDYVGEIPFHLNYLQEPGALAKIFDRYEQRQEASSLSPSEINVYVPADFYSERDTYEHAGIIFCPHASKTDLSVEKNAENLRNDISPDIGSFTGQDDDDSSIENLEKFRDNQLPIMVATKAFGMGIDKPNVRFTVNMNYSSSLEAFVQEAGRSGRDKRTALSVILVSDYRLARINPNYSDQSFPLGIIKNKWFYEEDLDQILNYYNLRIPSAYITIATPSNDVVKLHCTKDNRMFAFSECSTECSEFKKCNLRKVSPESKGWKTELELVQEIKAQGLSIGKRNFQYLNPDYDTVMYFFGNSFKGDIEEKRSMFELLSQIRVAVETSEDQKEVSFFQGFLTPLLKAIVGERLIVYVPYTEENKTDLSKSIYRMCCIELIEDFTQDYAKNQYRIEVVRKEEGGYFEGLERFLQRYYTPDRAKLEIQRAINFPLNKEAESKIAEEIFKCLGFLTEFVYDKISEKRKRAIDDMRNFCMEGLQEDKDWTDLNEDLKDFLFYYFNSKFAKTDYVTDQGEPFSLMVDTEEGKYSHESILFKFLRVIEDDVVGIGTPLDNVKHLYGAVRLISRSLTDENPTLALLEAFCLAYLQVKENENLKNQLVNRYAAGMIEFYERIEIESEFWDLFQVYNERISPYLDEEQLETLIEETSFLIHANQLKKITTNYLA
ncbi:DEAD/DEAH box helicase [Algoriphagus boseongensis]|uniref:DEAD/DEAH box helicase n=1 Tax=Algoriphagus boseongensis TaxID=1442587 RepID=UPI0010600634|nr:DEAD/DEAH box helicase [Algoriphagus boseongensis]